MSRSLDALNRLLHIMVDPTAPASVQVAAANAVLDRAVGKPRQALEHTGRNGGPIRSTAQTHRGSLDQMREEASALVEELGLGSRSYNPKRSGPTGTTSH